MTLGSQRFELAGVAAGFKNKGKGESANEGAAKVKVVNRAGIGRRQSQRVWNQEVCILVLCVCSDPALSVRTISEMYSIR